MDIHDIKPPGDYGRFTTPAADATAPAAGEATFADAKGKLEAISPGGETAPPGLNALSGLNRASLQDPAKLEQAMHAAISELVDTGQISGSMSSDQKQSLVDFMSTDPMFRQQLESYLRKVVA